MEESAEQYSEASQFVEHAEAQTYHMLNIRAADVADVLGALKVLASERSSVAEPRAPKEETGPISGTGCDLTGFFSDFKCLDSDK
jgi:hypothetical protein